MLRDTIEYDYIDYVDYDHASGADKVKKILEFETARSCVKEWQIQHGDTLDIGCATGRYPLWFAQQGFNATGYDISPDAIRFCQERAADKPYPAPAACWSRQTGAAPAGCAAPQPHSHLPRRGLLLSAREGGAAPPIRRDARFPGGVVERAAAPQDVRKLALLFRCRLALVLVGFAHVFWHGGAALSCLLRALRLDGALAGCATDLAGGAGERRAGPHGGEPVQFRELLAQRERGAALALFDHLRRTDRRPGPHEAVDLVGLHRQVHKRPALLVTLLAHQVLAPLANPIDQHLSPAFGHQMRW